MDQSVINNFILFFVELWTLAIVAMLLHRVHEQRGLIPIMAYLIGLTIALNYVNPMGIRLELANSIVMPLGSALLVPIVLMTILIIYTVNGTFPARIAIFSVFMFLFIFAFIPAILNLHQHLPGVQSSASSMDDLISLDSVKSMVASSITFMISMLSIVIAYQGIVNQFPKLRHWVAAALGLLLAVWVDAIVYRLLSDFGTSDFGEILPGDVIAKTISALMLWPLLAYYYGEIIPRFSSSDKNIPRNTFDVLSDQVGRIEIELLKSQEELRSTRANLQKLTDNINEIFVLISPDMNRIDYVSPAFERICGIEREAWYENPRLVYEMIHDDDKPESWGGLFGESIPDGVNEFRLIRPDGELRWIRARLFPINETEGSVLGIAGIGEDITRQKLAQEQEMALEMEQKKVNLLREFISNATHDLKNPLAIINLKAELIARATSAEDRERFRLELSEQLRHLGRILDDLLTLSRIESSKTYAFEPLNLDIIIRDITRSMRELAESKQVTLLLTINNYSGATIMGDMVEFTRALNNLVGNAIHYTPAGGLVNIHADFEANNAVIKISDTGIGISPADLPNIFERFHRAQSALDAGIKGTGLGLSIVKEIIEKHHGEIHVESREGKGSTFTLRFPLRQLQVPEASLS